MSARRRRSAGQATIMRKVSRMPEQPASQRPGQRTMTRLECSYTAFCVPPPHHRPAQGACSAISPANDIWRSVNRIWLARMDGGMWIAEVCGTAICRDTPPHHTPRYIHMYVIMLGVAVTWPHAVGTLLSRCWSGWRCWQQEQECDIPNLLLPAASESCAPPQVQ
jgi:hypothetical protein